MLAAPAFWSVAAHARIADEELRRRYAGTFQFRGGDRERAGRDRAIERSTHGMPFFIRGAAKRRLRGKTVILPWVRLDFPAGRIRARVPGLPPAVSPDSGQYVKYYADGEDLRLSQRFVGERLVQRIASEHGLRVNTYEIDDAGRRLRVHVRMTSPRLPHPVEYVLSYGK